MNFLLFTNLRNGQYPLDEGKGRLDNCRVIAHPLVQQKLGALRDRRTDNETFRRLVHEMSKLMCYEITRDLPLKEAPIETPLEKTAAGEIDTDVVIVPVLRAGLGMLDAMLELIPNAKVGFVGLYRNEETLEAVTYYGKFPPDLGSSMVIVVDPMLATGGSAVDAITQLKEKNATNIKYLSIVAAPAGLKKMQKYHPDVMVFTASVDRELNDRGYILPGLGDAGDRLYGTR